MSAKITVALARDQDAEPLATFYREAWNADATPDSVRASRLEAAARNLAEPGKPPPAALVFEGSRIIGYCGSLPQRLWDGATSRPAYWVKGLMVLPEFRNGPVGFLVLQELASHLPCSTSLAVAPAARRLLTALGYTDVGPVPNFIRALRPRVIAQRVDLRSMAWGGPRWLGAGIRAAQRTGIAGLAAAGAGALVGVALAPSRMYTARLTSDAADTPSDRELDDLWWRARAGINASSVRDASHLRRHFLEQASSASNEAYTLVATREHGELAGIAVLRRPKVSGDARLGGIRVATLADIVFPPERTDAGLATMSAVEREARRLGADAVLASTGHPAVGSVLRRQAYARIGGNLHFFVRDTTDQARWPVTMRSWWLARGDGQSDETF